MITAAIVSAVGQDLQAIIAGVIFPLIAFITAWFLPRRAISDFQAAEMIGPAVIVRLAGWGAPCLVGIARPEQAGPTVPAVWVALAGRAVIAQALSRLALLGGAYLLQVPARAVAVVPVEVIAVALRLIFQLVHAGPMIAVAVVAFLLFLLPSSAGVEPVDIARVAVEAVIGDAAFFIAITWWAVAVRRIAVRDIAVRDITVRDISVKHIAVEGQIGFAALFGLAPVKAGGTIQAIAVRGIPVGWIAIGPSTGYAEPSLLIPMRAGRTMIAVTICRNVSVGWGIAVVLRLVGIDAAAVLALFIRSAILVPCTAPAILG